MEYIWISSKCYLERELVAIVSPDLRVRWAAPLLALEATPNFRRIDDVRGWVELKDRHRRATKVWNRRRSEYLPATLTEAERRNRLLLEPASHGPNLPTAFGILAGQ